MAPLFNRAIALVLLFASASAIAQDAKRQESSTPAQAPSQHPSLTTPYTKEQNDWLARRAKERARIDQLARSNLAQAVQSAQKLVLFDRQVFGTVHKQTVEGLKYLGGLYYRQEDFASGVAIEDEILSIVGELYGKDHWRVFQQKYMRDRLAHLATLTREDRVQMFEASQLRDQAAQLIYSDPAKSIQIAENSAKLFEALLGQENPDYAELLRIRAQAYTQLNQRDKAETLLTEAARLYRGWHGGEGTFYAEAQRALGEFYLHGGEFRRAERAYRIAIDIFEREPGERNALYRTLRSLSNAYRGLQEYGRAEEMARRALELAAELQGKNSIDYISTQLFLGSALQAQQKYEEAERIYREASANYDRLKPPPAGEVGSDLKVGLAEVLLAKGDAADEALKLADQAKQRFDAARQKLPYGSVSARRSIAEAQLQLKNFAAADAMANEAVELASKHFGAQAGISTNALTHLTRIDDQWSRALAAEGKAAEGRALLQKLEQKLVEAFGKDHWRILDAQLAAASLEKYANLSDEQRRALDEAAKMVDKGVDPETSHADAIPLLEAGLETFESIYGKRDTSLLRILQSLGRAHLYLGSPDAAQPYFVRAIDLYRELFRNQRMPGAVGDLMFGVASTQLERGDYAQAIPTLIQVREEYKAQNITGLLACRMTIDLAEALIATGEFEKAQLLLNENLATAERTAGKRSEAYAEAIAAIHWLNARSNNYAAADKYFHEADKLFRGLGSVTEGQIRLTLQRGASLAEAGDGQTALPLLQWTRDALASYNSPRQQRFRVPCLRALAHAYIATGDFNRGEEMLREAITVQQAKFPGAESVYQSELSLLGRLLKLRADAAFNSNDMEDYLAAHRTAVALWKEFLPQEHWRYREAQAQLAAAEKVAALEDAVRRPLLKPDSVANRLFAKLQGPVPPAGQAKQRRDFVDRIRQAIGEDNVLYCEALDALVGALIRNGQYDEAGETSEELRVRGTALLGEKSHFVGRSRYWQGTIHRWRAEHSETIPQFAEAAEIYRDCYGDRSGEYGMALYLLGDESLTEGSWDTADECLRTAHSILSQQQTQWQQDYLSCLIAYGRACIALRDLPRAQVLFSRAHDQALQVPGQSIIRPLSARHLGELYTRLGSHDKAVQFLREAVDEHRKQQGEKSTYYAVALKSLANALRDSGDALLPGPLYEQAIDIFAGQSSGESAELATAYIERGKMYLARGESAPAQADFDKAAEIVDRLGAHASGVKLEAIAAQGDLAVFRGEKERALDLYVEHYDRVGAGLASATRRMAEQQHLEQMNRLRESLGWILSLDPRGERLEQTYAKLLSWKGAVHAGQQRLRAIHDNEELRDEFRQWEQLTGQLSTLALRVPFPEERELWLQQVRQLTVERDELERRLAAAAIFDRVKTPSPAELAKSLPEGAVFIDIVQYERRAPDADAPGQWIREPRLMAVVTRHGNSPESVDLGSAEDVIKDIDAWLAAVDEMEDLEKLEPLGNALKNRSWEPLEGLVGDASLVLLSPDGPLARFAWGALPGDKPGEFLIEKHSIVLVPVPALLPQLLAGTPQPAGGNLVAFGDVDYAGEGGSAGARRESSAALQARSWLLDFTDLANTGPEVDGITDMYSQLGVGAVTPLKGESANEGSFRQHAPNARWLHLATHAYFAPDLIESALEVDPSIENGDADDRDPDALAAAFHPGLLSGLALAGANVANDPDEDDGVLSALEVSALDLTGVELAVLSACQTAQGKEAGGEGVLGLQRAFQVAGARTVVSTLWPISDAATRMLMMRFYYNLWAKQMSRLEALRDAQVWMLSGARAAAQAGESPESFNIDDDKLPPALQHPAFWAPFVLSGDWR